MDCGLEEWIGGTCSWNSLLKLKLITTYLPSEQVRQILAILSIGSQRLVDVDTDMYWLFQPARSHSRIG